MGFLEFVYWVWDFAANPWGMHCDLCETIVKTLSISVGSVVVKFLTLGDGEATFVFLSRKGSIRVHAHADGTLVIEEVRYAVH